MKRQAYKRNLLFVLSMLLSPVFAQTDALSVDVPNLSPYADTEATTNIFFNGGDTDDRIFRLSLEQEYSYAAEIMEMVEMSPEWDDCLDETDTEEIEILYPTMGSLFAAQMPSNSCAYTWSVLERQEAFDSFLLSFSTTNVASLARKDDHAGFLALMFCLDKKYTNAVAPAKNIVRSQSSPYTGIAIKLLLDIGEPDLEMNSLVLGMATNHIVATSYDRCRTIDSYARVLAGNNVASNIVANAANIFFQNRSLIENCIPVDGLKVLADGSYSNSLSRLEFAREVLSRPAISERERLYFSNVTNLIISQSMNQ